jgi:hypothetical protein
MGSERDSWDVLVNTDVANTDVTLTWPNLTRLPKSQRLILIDTNTGRRTAMRTATQYTFRSNSTGVTTRRFVIQLTPASESGIRFSTVQATSLGTRIHLSYVLNREADVRLRVLNAAGKVVNALPPVVARSGLNTITWDGKAQAGLALSRGIYLIELSARSDEGEETKALKSVVIK